MKGGLLEPSSSVNFKSQENTWYKDCLRGLLQSEWDRGLRTNPGRATDG